MDNTKVTKEELIEALRLWFDAVSTTPDMSGSIHVHGVNYHRLNKAVARTSILLSKHEADLENKTPDTMD